MGLKPGNPNGTYTQQVPLMGFSAVPSASFVAGGKTIQPAFPNDFVAVSRRFVPEAKVENSDMVFVGYGVVAPEYGWDDYKGVDVKGKTIVMLINDPAIPDPNDPSKLDEKMFKGNAMTYYGRWTYKYEIATEKGAAAAIIIHETGPAGYPYEVVSGSWGRENFDIQRSDKNMGRVAVESWIHLDAAKQLLSSSGQDFDALKKAALSKDFKPVPLNAKANFELKNTLREVQSNNVIGKLEGSDPKLKDEYVIYTAHWDHLGKDPKLQGDQIFNGALDNASGTAVLLELAEAFTKMKTPPRRSVLFLAVTAEEKGLLGAKQYATNPLYPLDRTLANINMDGVNQWGRTKDIVVVGWGNSTLDDLLEKQAASHGRMVKPDAEPEKGFFYRSDHFEFAKEGVPALYVDTGTDFVGRPESYSKQKRDEYTERDYHKVSDEVKPDWDLAGAVEDTQLLLEVGYLVAQGDRYPEWKPGTEFKAKRDQMLRKE
jgi:Zn-dependent M28 family amino/carboxypeptidase